MFEGYERTFVAAKISPCFDTEKFFSIASKGKYDIPKQDVTPDLLPFNIVLASEHENLNGDYFSREELISARKTPINKPFNVEHMVAEEDSYITQPFFNRTKNTIIGHMTFSSLAKKDGTVISDDELKKMDKSDDPCRKEDECIDVIASAVLYYFIFPKTVADIKETSEKNKMFVSMECWFKDYDFLVEGKVVKKTEDNKEELVAKWQKAEKGKDGRRISRVLKNVLFGAVAATPTPANPCSVFLSTASLEQELKQLEKRHYELHVLQSICPNEEYVKEHDYIEKSAASIGKKIKDIKNG